MATPTSLPATFVAGNVLTAAQMNALRGAFRILQVVSTTKTDTFTASVASGASSAITGLSASITPSSTSSKILVFATVSGSGDAAKLSISLTRGGTAIGQPSSPGSRTPVSSSAYIAGTDNMTHTSALYLDSPASTSALSYGVSVVNADAGTQSLYVNRSYSDTDNADHPRSVSTITVMEVSA